MSISKETQTIQTPDSLSLDARLYKPPSPPSIPIAAVLVHPFSVLGGCQALMAGIARAVAVKGFAAVITFDSRGAGRSNGRASITGAVEVGDVVAVCRWVVAEVGFERILLVGSSADKQSTHSHPISPLLNLKPMPTTSKETQTIQTPDNLTLDARLYKPASPPTIPIAAVLVHPFSVLGGCQALMAGIARALAAKGFASVITFDSRGAGRSNGRASITGAAEVGDVVAVCRWVVGELGFERILLVGSSAGAPIAGSAVDKVNEVIGYVSIGYPFGLLSSILFGRHHKAILQSPKPKLFVMGTKDGFTSVKQLENKLKSASGRTETYLIEGASHFQMEGPSFDAQMGDLIAEFAGSLLEPTSSNHTESTL